MMATPWLRCVLLGAVLVLGACDGENCFVTGAECAPVGGTTRRELSAEEAHFMKLAFDAPWPDGRMIRWAQPIRIGFSEPATTEDAQTLEDIGRQLGPLLGDVDLLVATSDLNLRVSYVPRDSVRKLANKETVAGIAFVGVMDWEIQSGAVYVAQEFSGTARANILLHEIAHGIGLGGHSEDPASVLYPSINHLTDLPAHDEFAVRTLYSPKLTPGMTRDDARRALGW